MSKKQKHIISVDAGNGFVTWCMDQPGKKKHKQGSFSSMRARVTGDTLQMRAANQLTANWFEFEGERYVVGDEALTVARRSVESHRGVNRYGEAVHRALIAYACTQAGIVAGDVDLTVFAPPSMHAHAQEMIKERLQRQRQHIWLRGEQEPRKFRYSNVSVYPEGYAAALCFVTDDYGELVKSTSLAGRVLVVDTGVQTCDIIPMQDGKILSDELSRMTDDTLGIHENIRQPVMQELQRQGVYHGLRPEDIDVAIRRGIVADDWTLTYASIQTDIKDMVSYHAVNFAERIANDHIDGRFNGGRDARSIILVGGGTHLIYDLIAHMYGDKVAKMPRGVDPVDANAIAGLRMARRRLAKS